MRINEDIIRHTVASVIREFTERNTTISLGDYYKTPGLRNLCHEVKEGNNEAILKSAKLLSNLIEPNSVLIPIPSHSGFATVTKELCDNIARFTHCQVLDIVRGNRLNKTMYKTKLEGGIYTEKDLGYNLLKNINNFNNIYIVDNVVDTGTTSNAVNKLFNNKAKVLAIATVNK